ncbi:hypothetical protein ACFL18_00320 [Patescibacteria group bacterium]
MNKKTWLLIFSLCVGIIFSLPNIIPVINLKHYPNMIFTPLNGGDENLYAGQINQVVNNNFSNLPVHLPWFGAIIFGFLTRFIGSIDTVLILSDFILPIITFYLIYRLSFKLSRHFWASIIASLSAIFISPLTTKIPPITKSLFTSLINTLTLKTPYFFSFNRLIPPQFTFIIFMGFLWFLHNVINSSKKNYPLLTGLLSGLLAYNYFFEWSASLAILFIAFCFSFFYQSKARSKRLFLSLIISLAISSFYLYQAIFITHPDKSIMFGKINGRFIEPLLTVRYLLFGLITFKLSKTKQRLFLTSIVLAPVLLLNQQLITGFTIHPGHWPYAVFEPLVLVIGVILLSQFKFFKNKIITTILVSLILLFSLLNQLKITAQYQQLHYLTSPQADLITWLNQQAPDSILTLDKRLNRYLPVYAHHQIFLPYGSYSDLSIDQLWQRINLSFALLHFNNQSITSVLSNTQFVGQMFDQTYNYHQRSDLTGFTFPEDIKEKISQKHPVLSLGLRYIPDNLKTKSVLAAQKIGNPPPCQIPFQYLIIGPFENTLNPELYQDTFRLIYQNPDYNIYQTICN